MNLNLQVREQAKNLSLLYVEDDEETRIQISQIFKLFFQTILEADDGRNGLDLYKNNDIDLVISDLTMPNMNGATMIKEIKKLNPTQTVLVLTAHNSYKDLHEVMDLGIDGLLLKPMNMNKMLELLLKTTTMLNHKKDA